jgi:NADH-quinone oxidoreductase subunit L
MEHGEHHVHEHHAHDESHHDEHAHDHPFDPQDMMNMGGLRDKIPVTALTFAIGGLSLAGFPLLTAGFWSKDEILADAWLGPRGYYIPHAFVFFMLAAAAFLTAFYTMRQLCLTFWGEPRTEEAKHASLGGPTNIVSITMQLPLIILAVCAVVAGFVGVPDDFVIPPFSAIFSPEHNPFHHFVGATLLHEPPAAVFNWIPLLTSFGVALGGLYLGWALYGRNPLKAGEEDPVKRFLGRFHTILQNKYYLEELYAVAVVAPSQWFARVIVDDLLDKGIIDGVLHFLGRAFTFIGDLAKVLNLWLIDGVGDGIPEGIRRFGLWLRRVQTGRVQQYLLMIILGAIVIGLVFVLSTGLLQAAN